MTRRRASFAVVSFAALPLSACPTPLRPTCAEIEQACETTPAPTAETDACEHDAELGQTWSEAMCVSERTRCLALCRPADTGVARDASVAESALHDGAP